MRLRTRTLTVLLAACALAGAAEALQLPDRQAPEPPSAAAVPAPPELAAIRAGLLDRVRRGEVPSFAVGVVRGREIVWEEALGWADREANRPATPETLYPVASVSKSITGTGALALMAGGRLRLDQPVEEALGSLWPRGSAQGMLVSHLLAHTSGIPHLWNYEYPDRPETLVGRQELIRDYASPASPPGERFLYTNLGYGVLAEVVERAGGAPFQRVMESVLFEPLGMRHTTVDAWVGEGAAARGYAGDGKVIPYRYRLSPDGGAGFFSTVHDLVRYGRFHLGTLDAPVPAKEVAVVSALAELPAQGRLSYLGGWGAVRLPGATALLSNGEVAGGNAVLLLVPEKQMAVVVLCNATGGPSLETAVAILSAFIPAFDQRFMAAVEEIEREIALPGVAPAGRFEGFLFDGGERLAMSLDFSDPKASLLQLGGSTYLLQGVTWDHGVFEGTVAASMPVGAGKGRTHRLSLKLWRQGEELRGIAQEQLNDDRLRFGMPHPLVLKPVLGKAQSGEPKRPRTPRRMSSITGSGRQKVPALIGAQVISTKEPSSGMSAVFLT